MISIDIKQAKQAERALKLFRLKAMPHAIRGTLNGQAFKGMKIAQGNTRDLMTLRNKWTERSIQFDRATGTNVERMQSATGSVEDYMETQELGGETNKKGANKTGITTSYAAGQRGAKPRTRLARSANSVKNIRLAKKLRGMNSFDSRRQMIFITALAAATAGEKFVYIEPSGRDERSAGGVYRVFGTKKRKGRFNGVRMRMVYNTRKESLRIDPTPWLQPAIDDVMEATPAIYRDALLFQLKRHVPAWK